MAIVITIAAACVLAAGIAVLTRIGYATRTLDAPFKAELRIADANAEAARLIQQASLAAHNARNATLDELVARREAADSLVAVLDERETHLQERRAAFDERRFAHKKRREEIEARAAALAESQEQIDATVVRLAALDHDDAERMVLDRVAAELEADRAARVERTVTAMLEQPESGAVPMIIAAIERQTGTNVDNAPRLSPIPLENLDEHARERLLNALAVLAESTSTELGVDDEKAQATLRGVDPIGREIARQAALEVVDRRLQAAEVPPLVSRTRQAVSRRMADLGERALWEMRMEGRPELAELVGTLHYRFSYGQNALLHCEETGRLCGVLAAELGLPQSLAREAGMLHDIGKAVDHEVEGAHAIIGGELLRVLGTSGDIVHAVKAHHFDEEPSTDLAMLTICADAISASRPGARRDTLAAYLARLEQLQTIATRHHGVDRAYPLQAGREVRIFVKAGAVKDPEMPALSSEIAREIEAEMQYPGVIKVTLIRETTATATAPAQITPVRKAAGPGTNGHPSEQAADAAETDEPSAGDSVETAAGEFADPAPGQVTDPAE